MADSLTCAECHQPIGQVYDEEWGDLLWCADAGDAMCQGGGFHVPHDLPDDLSPTAVAAWLEQE